MSGRTPREAERDQVARLQRAVSCVTRDRLNVFGRDYAQSTLRFLTLGRGQPTPLQGDAGLYLSIDMFYSIVATAGRRGPFQVRTADYLYGIDDTGGHEILAYHWHPHGRGPHKTPHLHLGYGAHVGRDALSNVHLPTGLVTIAQIVRLTIEMGAKTLRDDWEEVLAQGQEDLEQRSEHQ